MKEFKVGDKVYYPLKSNEILTLQKNKSTFDYPLLAKGFSFTSDGKYSGIDTSPSLFHATPENHELLEKLYGVEFEKPPAKPTSKEIVQALFNKGHKYVPCWVSIDTEQPDNTSVWAFVKEINDDGWFIDQNNLDWQYVTPFNEITGEAITELPNE